MSRLFLGEDFLSKLFLAVGFLSKLFLGVGFFRRLFLDLKDDLGSIVSNTILIMSLSYNIFSSDCGEIGKV